MKKLKSRRLGFGFCLCKTEPSRRSKNYVALHIYFLRTLKSPLNIYPHCLTPSYLFFSLNKYVLKISLTDLFISPCDKNQHLKICLNHQTKILNHEDLKFTNIYIYFIISYSNFNMHRFGSFPFIHQKNVHRFGETRKKAVYMKSWRSGT